MLSNQYSELRRISKWVHRIALAQGCTRELVHAVELSVNETLTNIISYAYRDDTQHEIVVELLAQPERICVRIEDDGVPFDPLKAPIAAPSESLAESSHTGRGILLMRNLMDELHYERGDNRNSLTMVARCVKNQ